MANEQIQYPAIGELSIAGQPREWFDEETIAGLAESIKEVGLQQPLRVRRDGDKLFVVDGERRLRAAKKAGLQTIAVIIEEKELAEAEVIQRQLVANCQRDDFTPMEKAKAIDRLMKATGWLSTQLAGKLGLSNAAVSRSLALLTLPETIQHQVATGKISASAAYQLAQVGNSEKQAALAQQVADKTLTRDGLAGQRQAQRKESDASSKGQAPSRVSAKLSDGRSVTVNAANLNLSVFIEVLESLVARARQARTKGVNLGQFIKLLKTQILPEKKP
jgi:ParB/RepB/Spo0J family partition protein